MFSRVENNVTALIRKFFKIIRTNVVNYIKSNQKQCDDATIIYAKKQKEVKKIQQKNLPLTK